MPTPSSQQNTIAPQTLRVIRLALMLGPVLVGAVFAFLTMQNGPFMGDDPALAGILRLVFIGIAAAAALGVFAVQRQYVQATTYQRQATFCIVGWALAEMAAMLGAIYLLLVGSGIVFLIGLLVIGVAFLLLPIPSST